jgi:hypothetical protein
MSLRVKRSNPPLPPFARGGLGGFRDCHALRARNDHVKIVIAFVPAKKRKIRVQTREGHDDERCFRWGTVEDYGFR